MKLSKIASTAVLVILAGCAGSFPMKKDGHFHRGSQEKYIQTSLFWEFAKFPMYEFAVVGNAFMLNPIELWTGVRTRQVRDKHHSELYFAAKPAENGIDALIIISDKTGRVLVKDRITRIAEGIYEVYDSEGVLKATIFKTDAGFAMR